VPSSPKAPVTILTYGYDAVLLDTRRLLLAQAGYQAEVAVNRQQLEQAFGRAKEPQADQITPSEGESRKNRGAHLVLESGRSILMNPSGKSRRCFYCEYIGEERNLALLLTILLDVSSRAPQEPS